MVAEAERGVNALSGCVSVKFKASQWHKPGLMRARDAIERAYASPEFHLGSQWFLSDPGSVTAETPYRYWPCLDFDDKAAPQLSLRQCWEFIAAELEPLGLEQGTDFVVCVSGTKGAKVFLRWLTKPNDDAPRIWHAYLSSLTPRWKTLDTQIAYQGTLRGPYSRHPKQTDRWQSVIEEPSSILARNPKWALRQTTRSERPAFGEWCRALPSLAEPSAAFSALWQRAESVWMEKQLAAVPKRSRPSYKRRGTDVAAILEANGIGFREGHGMTGEHYYRLNRCIFCGGRAKAAIKAKSLFYDCFRQRCSAAGGMPIHEWIQGLEVPEGARGKISGTYRTSLKLRPRAQTEALPLLKARHRLFEEISRVVDQREGTTLIRCTPGLGKTHTTLSIVADRLQQREAMPKVVMACPTRELAHELAQRATEFDLPLTTKTVVVEGRSAKNCEFPGAVANIGRLGWSPGKAFCAACPEHGTCRYYRTLRDAADKHSLVFTTHEGAIALLDSDQVEADLVIFDEDPYRAVHGTHTTTLREISKAARHDVRAIQKAGELLGVTMTLATLQAPEEGTAKIEGPAFIELLTEAFLELTFSDEELRGVLFDCISAMDEVEPINGRLAGAPSSVIRALLPKSFFELVGEIVRDVDRAAAGAEWNPTTALVVRCDGLVTWECQVRNRPSSFMPNLILDAYGDATIYERLLGVPIDVVNISASLERSRFYYVPVRTSREAIKDTDSPAWKELERVMSELQQAGPVLVGTYQSIAAEIEKRFGCEVYHFGRGRGIDAYRDVQAVVLFGVPTPPPDAVMERARFLFQDDAEPLSDAPDESHRRLFSDWRVQRACDSMRESEAAQLAHRVRPVLAPRTVVSIGMVDYPSLPEPSPFPLKRHGAHEAAMEAWVRDWFEREGWFTAALIGEGVCPIPPVKRPGPLWRRIFGSNGVSLSPHRTLSARRVWGDRDKAREWVRKVAREQGIAHWEEL